MDDRMKGSLASSQLPMPFIIDIFILIVDIKFTLIDYPP